MEVSKGKISPDTPEGPSPSIDIEMVKETFNILASKGYIYFTETAAYVPTESGWKFLRKIKTVREKIRGFGNEDLSCNQNFIKLTKKEKDKEALVVRCDKSSRDLNEIFKNSIKSGALLETIFSVNGKEEKIISYGSPALLMNNENDIEIRKDDKISDSTIGIMSNKGCFELEEDFLKKIKEGKEVEIELIARI